MTDFTTILIVVGDPTGGEHHNVAVHAMPTSCPHLWITPTVRWAGDAPAFTGGLGLTHAPTGRRVTTAGGRVDAADLADLADRLSEFDWTFTDLDSVATCPDRDRVIGAIRTWMIDQAKTEPAHYSGDTADLRAARAADPAGTLLREQLDQWKVLSTTIFGDGSLCEENPAAWHALIAESCSSYGLIYLLAVLRASDPQIAAIAANDLVAAYDSGDSMGEWVHQWAEELTTGKPLTLPGIPTAAALEQFVR